MVSGVLRVVLGVHFVGEIAIEERRMQFFLLFFFFTYLFLAVLGLR